MASMTRCANAKAPSCHLWDCGIGWSRVQALPAMGSPAQNKISSPQASLAQFRRGGQARESKLATPSSQQILLA